MKIVFTNGCFDILHIGHIKLFEYCKNFGDYLVVGIDSDQRVSKNKGNNRPINYAKDRRDMLLSIKYIDQVEIFNTDEELINLIKSVSPNTMVVGSDWKDKRVIGSEFTKELRFFNRIEKYASSKTIQNIIDRR
jgi:D-beta-D-heptose 7-phosphate kinase/D-beta-D-heptose 1-phosphate adenosyltransferase